jgi:hypothetical protein
LNLLKAFKQQESLALAGLKSGGRCVAGFSIGNVFGRFKDRQEHPGRLSKALSSEKSVIQ